MKKTTNNTNDTEKKENNINTRGKGRKIAIISLICAAVTLVIAAVCIGAFGGLNDVPNNSSKQQQTSDDDEWTNNY